VPAPGGGPPALAANTGLLGAAFDMSLLALKAKKHGSLSDEDLELLNNRADAIQLLSVTYLRPYSSSSSFPSSPEQPCDSSSSSSLFSSSSSSYHRLVRASGLSHRVPQR
jgi:hypothetical protein